jgi:hypothetical protein
MHPDIITGALHNQKPQQIDCDDLREAFFGARASYNA